MGKINDGILRNWNNGEVMNESDYEQEREILRVAINDNYDRLILKYDKTEIDTLLASLKGNGWSNETIKGNYDLITSIQNDILELTSKSSKLSSDGDDYTGKWHNFFPSQISGSNVNIYSHTWIATEGQTVFTLPEESYSYSPGTKSAFLEIGGVGQTPGTHYTETDGRMITTDEGVSAGTLVKLRYFLNNAVTETNINTMVGYQENVEDKFTEVNTQLADITISISKYAHLKVLQPDGFYDWSAAINTGLSELKEGQSLGLEAGADYFIYSPITFPKSYIGLGTVGNTSKARLLGRGIGDLVIMHRVMKCSLFNVKLQSSAASTITTLLRLGNGDTWYNNITNVEVIGNHTNTVQGVCYTNSDVSQYRDYFTCFDRVKVEGCQYNWVLGGDWSSGAYVPAAQEVNRLKLRDCDDRYYSVYGIYMGNGNGHTIRGHHFDSAKPEAIADIYWNMAWTHVEAMFESGAQYAVDFSATVTGGVLIGSFYAYAKNFKYADGDSVDGYLDAKFKNDLPMVFYNSDELGEVITPKNIQTSDILAFEGRDLRLNVQPSKKLSVRRRDPATNTFGAELFNVSYNGHVSTPLNCAFRSYRDGTLSIPSNTYTKVKFNSVDFDQGGNWQPQDTLSRFYVPEDGIYQISVQVAIQGNAESADTLHAIRLYDETAGTTIAEKLFYPSSANVTHTLSVEGVFKLIGLHGVSVEVRQNTSLSETIPASKAQSYFSCVKVS